MRCNFLPVCAVIAMVWLQGCSVAPRGPQPDPDVARARIEKLLPATASPRSGWAVDIFAALEALEIEPDASHVCAVLAVTEQESTFQVDPAVPGLPAIARREIDTRAQSHGIPQLLVRGALALRSPDGTSYRERLEKVRTEKQLSEMFEDFIRMVPLGERLFGDLNPVRTGGPMQVSIAFAELHAKRKRYPYPVGGNIRAEVFTRRGGLYFGIAHLLDYDASYDDMVFRFADFNAGHYASRNAAFQNAIALVSGRELTLDGDLLRHGARANEPSNTELAVRSVAARLEMTPVQIRRDLEKGDEDSFEQTRLYSRLYALADRKRGRPLPRAMIPRIPLSSPKITRKLTTRWFAERVDGRYKSCLARARAKKSP